MSDQKNSENEYDDAAEQPRVEPATDVPSDIPAESEQPSTNDTPIISEDDATPFDDQKTDEAIDDIVAKEGDQLLAVQDQTAAVSGIKVARKGLWSRWWHSKLARWLTILLILGGIGAAAGVPTSRYFILNKAGVRSSVSVIVVDKTTRMQLKGVQFIVAGQKALTDSDGKAALHNIELGPTTLELKQAGFASIKRKIVIGWGSNPLSTITLQATGVQYVIEVQDYLSEKPIAGVEATGGSATAISNKKGSITLTLPNTAAAAQPVEIVRTGYRTENLVLNPDPEKPTKLLLVPARKAVFVVKRSGRYDIYKSDIDNKNRELLLAGTGGETSNMSLVISPDGARAALVSTRENKRDGEGALLNTLVLITIENGETISIAQAPQILLIDWIGPRLVFEQVGSDSSATNRYVVTSYNYSDNTRLQLAAASKLNAVLSAQGSIYYVVAADESNASIQPGLFKTSADGTGKQHAVKADIWTVLRTDYNTLSLQQADSAWYAYNIPNGATKQSTPLNLASQAHVDNTDRTKSLWIFQGGLLSYDVATGKSAKISGNTVPSQPVQWIGPTAALYRVATGSETADYAVSIEGGAPHKVTDVFMTYGFAQAQ